ncbi:MAG TPA: helicase-exonuclease AddAB subunit AddB [Candidatus Choladousia intestinipullorum]|nr:helicase-exonuclease AddAB subunit AddB [Candidatus Choladousia intestinipullorum]
MALQFIMGNSGSGKSRFLYQKVIGESLRHPDCNYLVIVPEQFTMQTQKDLVMMHPDRGIMNIDVLSFGRLAHRVFEEVGRDGRTVLTETGKNLMLRKVVMEQKDHLQVLGGRIHKPGYISEMKSILSELMQYEITDFELQEMMKFAGNRPLLRAKLGDVRVLYRAFLDYQRERFMKPEELLDVLCQVAGQSELLKKSCLAFDGFAGFTPAQMNVLEELLAICPRVWMTVTIDAREPFYGKIEEHELFAPSRKLIKNVREAAGRVSEGGIACEIEEPVVLGRERVPRFREKGALLHLEQNLFRKKRAVYKEETQEEISLHLSATPAEEVHFAARTICRLVRECGFRYHDIAVITGNLGSYDHYVKKIFPMYDVPAFLDETRRILLNPCLEFIRGALLAVEKDFSGEAVFRLLRTDMLGLSSDAVDRLENYVMAAGIRGYASWMREWEYLPGRMTQEELAKCNEYRRSVMGYLQPFAEKMRQKKKPYSFYAGALCDFLEEVGVQQKLKDRETALLEEGAREEAREYSQIYGILIALLDEMVELLGGEEGTGKEFSEVLDAGFEEASVGIIPPGIDQVQVGDIERSRLAHVKVLFFLGLNDGWVPVRPDGSGIISDMERELLAGQGMELAPSARENSYIQRFYLYQNLTKPSDRLYLSWCESSGDGTAMRPSYLVSVIQKLFPRIQTAVEAESGTDIRQVTSKKNGLLYLTKGLEAVREGCVSPAWMELYQMYLHDEAYCERVQELVQAAFSRGGNGKLSYQISKELYGEVMTNSVTRLEQFAACAFAHFASYGLHLSERELYGVKAADLGIIFHRAMELFSRRLLAQKKEWNEIPEKEQELLMEQCVDEISKEYGMGILHGSARDEYTIVRVKRILCRTIWAMHRQLAAGTFRPSGFEVSFADAGDLEAVNVRFAQHGRIRLQGRIDRIDTASEEDKVYVKIVDYKSGNTKFDLVSLYYGLQLQLVVYLNAALEMERRLHPEKEVIPAGIFYYHFEDPVLEKEAGLTSEVAEERILKKLRPDGILNGDPRVLRMLDGAIGGDSLVIPAGLKKDGSLKAASSAVSTEQFEQLSDFVSSKMEKMAEEIMDGVIDVKPFADRTRSACDYCSYADVCGFDRKIPGMCRKQAPELSKGEVWERIAGEAEARQKEKEDETEETSWQ